MKIDKKYGMFGTAFEILHISILTCSTAIIVAASQRYIEDTYTYVFVCRTRSILYRIQSENANFKVELSMIKTIIE